MRSTTHKRDTIMAIAQPCATGARTITFPQGFVGLADWREFDLEQAQPGAPVWLLQNVHDSERCFVLIEPAGWWPEYAVPLGAGELSQLGAKGEDEVMILCTTRTNDHGETTANLLGPLAVNLATGVGLQVVLYDSSYTTEHLLPLGEHAAAQPVQA